MCYAIPGKLVEIKKNIGIVDYFGEKKNVLLDYGNAKVGDYIYAQGGILVNTISKREALEILETWKELFFELKKTDEKLAEIEASPSSKNLLAVLQEVNLNKTLTKDELLYLFALKGKNNLRLLYETANNIRQKTHGNACCVHGILEFSNVCENNCFYCGIRKERKLKRYRMGVSEIIDAAKYACGELGFKALVLQSGEDNWYTEDKLTTIVSAIRKLGVLVFLSIGQRNKTTYKRLYEAGSRAALLRFETSNKEIFETLRPGTTLASRLELIRYLKELGFILATGFISGLPGETSEDVINNILLTKSLKPDMHSFGPFIPAQDTPLKDHATIRPDEMLKTIAISRLIDKDSNILVTTALETLEKEAKRKALLAGANSLMINVTPKAYKNLYRIYDGRVDKDINKNIKETIAILRSLGRAPADLGL
ncbi:MAG: HypC/HybG/HupF family hydrogenase formation chaperone [Candidatus Omnitrophica bacterium]|nr:HypC/HybG/HupF family hydrogenase formation chaperone [Candidatus Omnitrophota bacterium]